MVRRGFATVELLQVIAIIAVLVGISFPAVAAVRRRAQHASCAERLHQLGLAITLYANDHDGWVPPRTTAEDLYSHVPGVPLVELRASPELLVKEMSGYVRNREVWFCPADPQRGKNGLWLAQRHRWTSYFFYPQMPGSGCRGHRGCSLGGRRLWREWRTCRSYATRRGFRAGIQTRSSLTIAVEGGLVIPTIW